MDPHTRRKTLRLLSNGMYVVTSRQGETYGAATITWLSQASFKPPLIMVAIRADSSVFKCLSQSRVAAVHILSSEQQEIAGHFFKPTIVVDQTINGEPFIAGKTAAPLLRNVQNYVECSVRQIIETGGDHTLVVMEVVEAVVGKDIQPLTIRESPWEYGG